MRMIVKKDTIKHKPGIPGLCFIAGLVMYALFFNACEKEKPEVEADMSISKVSISISSTGGDVTTRIKSDQNWSITEIDQDWVEADIMSGAAGVMTTVRQFSRSNPEPRKEKSPSPRKALPVRLIHPA